MNRLAGCIGVICIWLAATPAFAGLIGDTVQIWNRYIANGQINFFNGDVVVVPGVEVIVEATDPVTGGEMNVSLDIGDDEVSLTFDVIEDIEFNGVLDIFDLDWVSGPPRELVDVEVSVSAGAPISVEIFNVFPNALQTDLNSSGPLLAGQQYVVGFNLITTPAQRLSEPGGLALLAVPAMLIMARSMRRRSPPTPTQSSRAASR